MLLAVLCLVTTSLAAPGSHEVYARQAEAARDQVLRESVQLFDDYLKQHPGDDVAAIERCKLLAGPLHDDEGEETGDPAAFSSCLASLQKDLPLSAKAVRYRLEFLGQAEADKLAREALDNPRIAWQPVDRAAVYAQLATREKNVLQASRDAGKAMELDPSLDLSKQVAEELFAEGRRVEGIVVLSRSSDDKPYQLLAKARLLAGQGAYARALWLIEKARPQLHGQVDPILDGDVLANLGELKRAREAYVRQKGDFKRKEILLQLLRINSSLGDEAEAVKSYEQLLDLGNKNDPFALRRLALARKFPHAPWHGRDFARLLSLLILLLVVVLLPGVVLIPLHYRSLWLRLQKPPPDEPVKWRFRHVWLVSSAFLLAQCWFFGQLDNATAEALGFDGFANPEQHYARMFLGYVLAMSAVTVALLLFRRDRFRLLGLGSWSWGMAAAQAAASLLILYLVAGLVFRLFGTPPVAGVPPIDSMIRAFLQAHGRWLTFLTVALAVPIIEELFFRSLLLDLFTRWLGYFWANALQAALFAAAHGDPKHLAFYFVFGLLVGRLRHKSGGLLPAIAVHAFWNALVVVGLLSPASSPPVPRAPLTPYVSSQELFSCAQTPRAKTQLSQAALTGGGVWPMNNLAWEIALDGSSTPDCLERAEALVDSSLQQLPDRPPFIDTKATVLFRRGRGDEAVDLEAAALSMAADRASYGTQLDRFLRKSAQPLRGGAKPPRLSLETAGKPGIVLELGEELPVGGTVVVRANGEKGDLGIFFIQFGPGHDPSYRIPLPDSLPPNPKLELAFVDARGSEFFRQKQWHWYWLAHDPKIDAYP
jgi:membrane protease YdiL (CAAX protease family)